MPWINRRLTENDCTCPFQRNIAMSQRPPSASQTTSATLRLSVGDLAISPRITVPAGPVPAGAVLPALQGVVNAVVDGAERAEGAAGRAVSCRKGCGACCRQLVPVSRTEARAIAALVEALPRDRRLAIRERFAVAAARLREAGLAETLLDPARRTTIADRTLSVGYFALGMSCPFLEDESCSIHADRPLACREYLVTSPAANCSDAEQAGVVPVAVPKLSVAARGLEEDDAAADTTAQWLPLTLALHWAATAPPPPRPRRGPEWVQRFLVRLRISKGAA
jgi:Fe-S-cluster containining protein